MRANGCCKIMSFTAAVKVGSSEGSALSALPAPSRRATRCLPYLSRDTLLRDSPQFGSTPRERLYRPKNPRCRGHSGWCRHHSGAAAGSSTGSGAAARLANFSPLSFHARQVPSARRIWLGGRALVNVNSPLIILPQSLCWVSPAAPTLLPAAVDPPPPPPSSSSSAYSSFSLRVTVRE